MTAAIRDLIHFEEVEEVIKLRKEEKAQEYVETYVISDSLRRNLLYMLEILASPTHKSFNVVGNYGTGKSHFLFFVAALLEHPEMRALVRDDRVRSAAQKLERRYLVVKFELGAAAETPLRHIFFDQVRRQLLDRYDIEVRDLDLATAYDNKRNVLDILADIKASDPEAGLVVVVDEISDFLKQKPKETMTYDLALLRELGEVSQDSDFLYIGAMQEHVFTNPKYVDQAENIARINQRFVTVTITKDDVGRVLTERVLRKDADQRLRLQGLLGEHRAYFTNLADQMERYVDLFPIHPYVIDVFERLPYFENRGIIGFAVNTVKPILDQPAPQFVTYDRVYDLIDATHEIRNQPDVAQVVGVVQTLQAKVDLLDSRIRGDARKLIKALAVLKLLGGANVNGANSQELANTLFITPPGRLVVEPEMARDNIERIMRNIREVTVGQYIAYGADGRYFLDLTKIDDYDALIERKALAVVDSAEIESAFRQIVVSELGLKDQKSHVAGANIYADTASWPSRRSYRPGLFAIGRSSTGPAVRQGDYTLVIAGPQAGKGWAGAQDEIVLTVDFADALVASLTRARSAELLAQDRVHTKVMEKLAREAATQFREDYLARLLASGRASYRGHQVALASLPARRPLSVLADVVDHVKGALLDDAFAERYPQHPVFKTTITAANLESEMTRALQSLDRVASQQMDLNSRGYLESFGAWKDDGFSASGSPTCALILERIQANDATGKMTPVDDLVRELAQSPWGLPREMVYFLLGALLFNGYVTFVKQGGGHLHAGDVSPLLKTGLRFFDEVRYLERDRDIDVEGIAALFGILGLQQGLVRNRDSRADAVKALRERGQALKEQVAGVRTGMQLVIAEAASYPQAPWLAIQAIHGRLGALNEPLAGFASASRVADLGKLDTSTEFCDTLRQGLNDIETLASFLRDWQDEGLAAGLKRMQAALDVLPKLEPLASPTGQATIADLRRIASESAAIVEDERKLLKADQRRPLKGKLEQFRQKYDPLYFNLHRQWVGDGAPWAEVEALRRSPRYAALGRLKSLPFISPAEFNQIGLALTRLEQRRCRQFNAQVLDSFVACPYCSFPDNMSSGEVSGSVQALSNQVDELWDRWQAQVLHEIAGLAERMPLLSASHRSQIENLQRTGSLPDQLPDDLAAALHELASDLQAVTLDLADLAQTLLARGAALTVEDLRTLLDSYLADLWRHRDPALVRIRIVVES